MFLAKLKNTIFNKQGQDTPFDTLPNITQGKNKIQELLKTHPTPIFIVDEDIYIDRLEKLTNALKANWGKYQIAYSFKTNYEFAKLNIIKKNDLWIEVVSGNEYQMAKKLKLKSKQIIFNGPYKRDGELIQALKDGALIFIDNFNELTRLLKITRSQNKSFNIGLRINTEVPYLNESRFGFSIDSDEAKSAIAKINSSKNLKLVGFHIHIGTDIDNPVSYRIAARSLCRFLKTNIPNYQNSIKLLNFGGGFPAQGKAPFGKTNWKPQSINQYIKVITEELEQVFPSRKVLLVVEPGRYLVDDATLFLTKVISQKYSQDEQRLITNAAVTMLPLVYYRPQIVKLFDKNLKEKTGSVTNSIVYGATCKEDDILYQDQLPIAETGDYLAYYVVGAYNQNMSSSFIFEKPKLFSI
jgi:diaminopimelate decarboxylase